MLPAIILFVATYVLMLIFDSYRPYIAMASGVIFVISGMLPAEQIIGVLDFNVLLMIGGTMGLVKLFIDSRMPACLADLLLNRVSNVRWAAVALSLLAGIISAFVDNVATVLMIAPVAIEICKKIKTDPVPFIISIAVSSNLQGAATLVGDTTAIMLGSALDMSFLDFIWYEGRFGMFFVVEMGAVCAAVIIYFAFRNNTGTIPKTGELSEVEDIVPTVLLVSAIALLILVSFLPFDLPEETNGLICVALLAVGLIYDYLQDRNPESILETLKAIDYETLGLLVGLFLMIGGITNMGVIDALAALLVQLAACLPGIGNT